jgi:acyl-CoA thioesterase-2
MAGSGAPRESLREMLKVEDRGAGAFAATLESFWGDATRGDLLARAALAASAGRSEGPSALQASFFTHPEPDVPLGLAREEIAADRTRVRARAGHVLLCEAVFRFTPPGDGLTYQGPALGPGPTAPEDLPSELELGRAEGWEQYAAGPIESRRIGAHTQVKDDEPAVWQGWLAPREPLPGDARVQAAALVFLAEYRSHWAVERRLGADFPRASIELQDFALWIHRTERWDDFWLVRTTSDVGAGGRCLSHREIYTRRGALVASAVWEAIVRLAKR